MIEIMDLATLEIIHAIVGIFVTPKDFEKMKMGLSKV